MTNPPVQHPPIEAFGPWQSNSNEGSCLEIAPGPDGWWAFRDTKGTGDTQFYDAAEMQAAAGLIHKLFPAPTGD